MACGCKKNQFNRRPVSGPRPMGAIRPVQRTTQNIIMPIQPQGMNQTTSQTPTPQRSASGAYNEKKKMQQVRRDAMRRAFNR
jgi:hypothetical protein